jgi:hypothetical protein
MVRRACPASQVSNKGDQTFKVLGSVAHLEAMALPGRGSIKTTFQYRAHQLQSNDKQS